MAFSNASDARAAGWFSRRNQGAGALMAYKDSQARKRAAQQKASDARDAAARKRSPQEQIARLDSMLGKGMGAARERARLNALLGKKSK